MEAALPDRCPDCDGGDVALGGGDHHRVGMPTQVEDQQAGGLSGAERAGSRLGCCGAGCVLEKSRMWVIMPGGDGLWALFGAALRAARTFAWVGVPWALAWSRGWGLRRATPEGRQGVGVIGQAGRFEWESKPSRDVVILGAGFSNKVSSHLPLTCELGQEALKRAGIPETEYPPAGTGFESWLSRIAEDQPYRTVEENLAARRTFVKMSMAIAEVLEERQLRALREPQPSWLDDLLSVLHATGATVVSFNYDNLLECAVDGHCLEDRDPDPGPAVRVTSHDIVDRLPPLPPAIASEELPRAGTDFGLLSGGPVSVPRDPDHVARSLRLLKLHGSLSWYWSPDDETGVTVQRWRTPGVFGRPTEDIEARRRALPGRVPFVVPPTASKSSYLTNLVQREIWGRARVALENATRVIVVGYSVPPEDQVAGGMLADALRKPKVDLVVVNPCADQVVRRLKRLGVKPKNVKCFRDRPCIEDFVRWYLAERAERVVDSLRAFAGDEGVGTATVPGYSASGALGPEGQVWAAWGPCEQPGCQARHPMFSGSSLAGLDSKPDQDGNLRLHLDGSPGEIGNMQLPNLLAHLSNARDIRRIVIQTPSGQEWPIVDFAVHHRQRYAGHWDADPYVSLRLVPTGHPRGG